MPTIDIIYEIKISIYNVEYRSPYIHACYNEFDVVIGIGTENIYAGDLPNKQIKKVFNWLAGNSEWALEVFYELNPELK